MRAGCFAEDRVIDLLNRRFVPFFYNRSGMGEGADKAAKKFAQGKTKNPYAFLAAFSADGTLLGETELYADKDAVFAWLQTLLVDHPEFAKPTVAEQKVLGKNDAPLERAQLFEELGNYEQARKSYLEATDRDDERTDERMTQVVHATLGLLRLSRHSKDWETHECWEEALRILAEVDDPSPHRFGADAEQGYRLVAQGKYGKARALLQAALPDALSSNRLAEMHFLAGKACWLLGDRDWAKFHWCWIVEHLPEDRLQRRAYICAAAEGMPYTNNELDGFKAEVGNIGTDSIVQEFARSHAIYRSLLPHFNNGVLDAELKPGERPAPSSTEGVSSARPRPNRLPQALLEERESQQNSPQNEIDENAKSASPTSPLLLVAKLRDGNAHVQANNKIVDQLEAIGAPALDALRIAVEDREFPGRGYAAWAISQVLKTNKLDNPVAREALVKASTDADPYVSCLADSGLGTLAR